MHEVEAVNAPIFPGDPTPWYATAHNRSGQTVAMGADCATEEEARAALLAVLDSRD